jgi:sugar phosphate isomerase/epimerase
VVDVARSMRFTAIEWGAGPREALERRHDPVAVMELCAAAGVAISGLSVQDHDVTVATPRRAAPYVTMASSLGARFIRLFAPPYRGGSLAREQRRARAGLDAVVDRAAADGIVVLIETSPGTLAPTPGLAAALVEHRTPKHAGVLFDPGNTVIEGYLAPALAVARLGPHLHHLHVKNIVWRKVSGAWAWQYAPLTGGMLAWPEILAALAAGGYRGGFSIDHLSGTPTTERLRSETQRLRALLSQVSPGGAVNDLTRKGGAPSPAHA